MATHLKAGDKAPPFTGKDQQGKIFFDLKIAQPQVFRVDQPYHQYKEEPCHQAKERRPGKSEIKDLVFDTDHQEYECIQQYAK